MNLKYAGIEPTASKVGAEIKGRQIFFSGIAKQNKVGAKERQVSFRGKAKQNEVGGKERPALMLEQK